MEPIIPTEHIPPVPPETPGIQEGDVPVPPPVAEEKPHMAHTYEDDLAHAMDATDATVVQELLATAREKEATAADEKTKVRQRSGYVMASLVLLLLAIVAVGYGAFHYAKLTVPVEKAVSVGVFPSTDVIVASATDIGTVIRLFTAAATPLPAGKPYLVSLVHDSAPQTLITNAELFTFMGAKPSEPFATSIDLLRYGMVNIGSETVPFIVASVPDAEKASKEFLIAEPDMLTMFYKALNIDISTLDPEHPPTFTSDYLYNLPVRSLHQPASLGNGSTAPIMLYGYATEHIVVVTTQPEALKAVYDTIIKQR